MNIMKAEFSTSVNIIRDSGKKLKYIPTPNAQQIVGQLVNDFKKGLRSFNIIGNYGTGKSSFLMALEQSLIGTQSYFNVNFNENTAIGFVKIIGSYASIIDQFAQELSVSDQRNRSDVILSELFNRYHALSEKDKILFIFIDEFGKFLEYASKNNPESELYFIQQLSEFCNNSRHRIVLLTTVHQGFDSYAYSLSNSQKQEWSKVKGRFREITFNEPIEQLIFLAAEHLSTEHEYRIPKRKIASTIHLALESSAFQINPDFVQDIAEKLYPLDIFSAYVLTFSLQKYGQNERSLFSFLESTDNTSLSNFQKTQQGFYHLASVYDYLIYNFYTFLISKYNPDFAAWGNIRSAIEKIERSFIQNIDQYCTIVKSIGLLNLFAQGGSKFSDKILTEYFEISCDIPNSGQLIQDLAQRQIIRYRAHSQRYILFEGTDLDIQAALVAAGNKVSEVFDIIGLLNKYFVFSPVLAKRITYEKGTPRYFEFMITDYPTEKTPKGEIDGVINLIFNPKLSISEVQIASKNQREAVIYCYFTNAEEIKSTLFEIEKIQSVISENTDDLIARRELENIVQSHIKILNHHIVNKGLYGKGSSARWFHEGTEVDISKKSDFNRLLSSVCKEVYTATPVFKNELVNRHKISTSIRTAKKNYFRALTNHWGDEDLGFDANKFPPEKSIYFTLLKENGIKLFRDDADDRPELKPGSSFSKLWKASGKFIENSKKSPQKVSELCKILLTRPFKLKQGFIDFWVPTYLFIRRNDFAVFNEGVFIPILNEENLELLAKYPDKYSIKTFDVDGIKLDVFNSYRKLLNQGQELRFDNSTFVETIKPFLQFYKQLPDYSKNTKRLNKQASAIRKAIAQSKDPEMTFFESFPDALGVTLIRLQKDRELLERYTNELQNAIREIRSCYDHLIHRFEQFICEEITGQTAPFPDYKERLQMRYERLKKHLLLPGQKTFVARVDSTIDDHKAWLNSLAQALLGRSLEQFADEDEAMLYEKFKNMILDLDSLTQMSNVEIDDETEEIIGVKIDTFLSSINPKLVRYPKMKEAEIEEQKNMLIAKLGSDKTINIASVVKLLKELLQ
jgi:hypothetical protein